MQETPAGLPLGIPGIGEDMEGTIQHAPQFILHGKEFINHSKICPKVYKTMKITKGLIKIILLNS